MDRQIDLARGQSNFDLFGEQPFAAGGLQRDVQYPSPVVLMTVIAICAGYSPACAISRALVSSACARASGEPRVPIFKMRVIGR
ncbi:MAG: hypothetical protein AAGF32_07150 [Pseudomonadota bacterium]